MVFLRRHPRIVAIFTFLVIALATASFAMRRMTVLTSSDPILEIWNDSLTTYLYSSTSPVQGVRPQVGQRGVNLDGSMRAASPLPMSVAGNPFESTWSGGSEGEVNLAMGTYALTETDLALPSPSVVWPIIGRTYNHRQLGPSGNHRDNVTYQGGDWFQSCAPEVVLYEHVTDDDRDTLVLIFGGDRFVEFRRVDIVSGTSNTFRATNGAAGCFQFASGAGSEPDTYTLTDSRGLQFCFFGFDSDSNPAKGQLWKITDPAGNVAYAGDSTTGSTAISSGYTAGGAPSKWYDTAGRRYTFTYSTIESVSRLTQVKAETKTGGTWASPSGVATVGQVDYGFYLAADADGELGDLKLVTKTIPQTDSGIEIVKKTMYKYYEGAFNASTNPGYPHGLKLVVDDEGCRNFDFTDSTFDEDFLSASTATLEPYASAKFSYDSSYRIVTAWFHGSCGCSGGSAGTFEYNYETNGSYSDGVGYDTTWAKRTVVKRPDGSYRTVYFDEANQALHSVVTSSDPAAGSPPDRWVTAVTRNSDGCVTEISTPANITGYTHSTGSITKSSSDGLVNVFVRDASGVDKNYVTDTKWKSGTSGTAYLDGSWAYDITTAVKTVGDDAVVRVFLDSSREYTTAVTSGTSGSNLWDYATTVHSGTLAVKEVTTTQPTVSTGNNGSNSAVTSSKYFNSDGTLAFEKDGDGTITYHSYILGQERLVVADADTTKTSSGQTFDGISIPSGFSTSGSGTAFHMETLTTHDAQGRVDTVTTPDGLVQKSYYSRLKDHRQVALHAPKFVAGTPTIYGPVSYSVTNHAGKTEVSATVALSGGTSTAALTAYVDETDADPITAMDLGTVSRLSTSILDESGTRVETTRAYFLVPASGAGSDGTNYDATTYGYDDSGRVVRTKDATGTIHRTVYDAIGRRIESWLGTNDADEAGSDNIVKTESVVYDGGADDGNSLITTQTSFVQDSTTDQRVTTTTYDVRGRAILITAPIAPHTFNQYDNLGRLVASGQYASTASITVGTDEPTTEASGRVALSQTFYDERGSVWKTQYHKIDPADGSDDDNLQSLTWYDADGRPVKQDGGQLTKSIYDRLGRETDSFVLASDNDSGYSDADDVTGDIVVEQHVMGYNATTGLLELETTVYRGPADVGMSQTAGKLDTNSDSTGLKATTSDLHGWHQVRAYWYDTTNRLAEEIDFGTHAFVDYDRQSANPDSRSDGALRTTYTYDEAGMIKFVTDPKAIVTKWECDALGRKTKEIRNYNAGVNSGLPSGTDDNVTTSWTYVDGLMTALTADVPAGETDQVTTYTYGTTKGTNPGDSKIATGNLLYRVAYPDSVNSADTVTYAYDAQGAQIYKLDQAGNVHETTYDALGRAIHNRWTTAISGFDTAVRRISSTYASDGDLELVTQWDNATVGSGSVVDEVKYTNDGWGNLTDFQYDRDSAVGSAPTNHYTVSYSYAKSTTGRNSIRRTGVTMPSGTSLTYEYESSSSHDDALSRLTRIKQGATELVEYEYNGAGQVVGTYYDEPDVFSRLHNGAGTYDAIDRFGRVTTSRWTKDLATDRNFYETVITWDRNSNPTSIEDNVHTGFDVKYDLDDLDRVVRAEEGTLSGGSITSRTRDQQWTLTHTGNWSREKLDLNGDGDFVDTDEHDDTRTHNAVNELTARDTDSNASNNYSLTYDAVGNLTDDAEDYKYVYDGFGRLRYIQKTSNSAVVAEYKYNGLGFRTAQHEDTDVDGDVDGSDKWYYLMYDERWRHLSTFRETDTSPKEEFVPQQAGIDGYGGSSYIDLVVCRNRDESSAWTSASDGTLETRIYYEQNWRADVSAIVTSGGMMLESTRYRSYGVRFGLPRGDTDSDGDCDSTDQQNIVNHSGPYDSRYDINLDGNINSSDASSCTSMVLGLVEKSSIDSMRGQCGVLSLAGAESELSDVRSRIQSPEIGRWLSRDPLAYVDGNNLLEFDVSNPAKWMDPLGLSVQLCSPSAKGFSPVSRSGHKDVGTGYVKKFPGKCIDGERVEPCHFDLAFASSTWSPPGTASDVTFAEWHGNFFDRKLYHYLPWFFAPTGVGPYWSSGTIVSCDGWLTQGAQQHTQSYLLDDSAANWIISIDVRCTCKSLAWVKMTSVARDAGGRAKYVKLKAYVFKCGDCGSGSAGYPGGTAPGTGGGPFSGGGGGGGGAASGPVTTGGGRRRFPIFRPVDPRDPSTPAAKWGQDIIDGKPGVGEPIDG